MHRYACLYVLLSACACLVGCSSTSPTVTNPFTTADRVPPPTMRAVEGVTPVIGMPAATTMAPTFGSAPPFNPPGAAPVTATAPMTGAVASPYTSASPYGAAPSYGTPPSTYAPAGTTPAPGTATPYYGASTNQRSMTPGDTIAVPTDSGALRFATPSDSMFARQSTQPVPRAGSTQITASSATQRSATASGWIAGSAPVRTDTLAGSPRVRVPGQSSGYEPVSIAAISGPQSVPIAPLEPAPTGLRPGEAAPLRVATPPSNTGWR
jgi:hypothetical protein